MPLKNPHFGTRAVHAGQAPDPQTGAVMQPIYQNSTFAQKEPGVHQGYEYARTGNPTRTALEANLAALESASDAICFSSGMAAADAVLRCCQAGDHILACDDLYGGSYRLFTQVFSRFGMEFSFADLTDVAVLREQVPPHTKLIWIETPTNPLLRVYDIEALAKLAHSWGALLVVDNTFATPYLQRPLERGADIVIHSLTKYLGGHSDVIGGAAMVNNQELAARLRFLQNAAGAVPGPQDCFLVLRGTKTLHLRMERHCQNARAVAAFLHSQGAVKQVYYPGLAEHPHHALAARQMDDFGGMVSFELDHLQAALAFCKHTELFTLAESLGGVESLVEHPAIMTHASIPREVREKAGLRDGLIRLSVGVEAIEDLLTDLEQALARSASDHGEIAAKRA